MDRPIPHTSFDHSFLVGSGRGVTKSLPADLGWLRLGLYLFVSESLTPLC